MNIFQQAFRRLRLFVAGRLTRAPTITVLDALDPSLPGEESDFTFGVLRNLHTQKLRDEVEPRISPHYGEPVTVTYRGSVLDPSTGVERPVEKSAEVVLNDWQDFIGAYRSLAREAVRDQNLREGKPVDAPLPEPGPDGVVDTSQRTIFESIWVYLFQGFDVQPLAVPPAPTKPPPPPTEVPATVLGRVAAFFRGLFGR